MDRLGDGESPVRLSAPEDYSGERASVAPRPIAPAVDADVGALVRQLPDGFDVSTMLGIADALPVMVAYCDTDLRYRFVNKPLAEWMEVDRKQILGRTIREVMGEEGYAPRAELLQRAIEGEAQWFAADYHHPARGLLTTQADYIPNMGPEGEVMGLTIIVQDVTEQRVAGQALSESELRFRRIADSAPALIWVTRRDGSRDFVNQACERFFGVSPHTWMDRIHPDDHDPVAEQLHAARHAGSAYDLTARVRNEEGDYRWLNAIGQPRFGADGVVVGHLNVATDVTIAKEAELALRSRVRDQEGEIDASEARFRAVFDSLDMVGIMDLDGRYIELNASAREGLGLKQGEIEGKYAWEVAPIAGNETAGETMRALVAAGKAGISNSAEIDVEFDGAPATHMATIKPVFDANGEPAYLVGQARDITALKVAQDQLRQAQKMEALGQLTGGLAHDFNNLLTVVVGGLDLISKRVEDEKLKRYADNALAAAQRGARLTGQLLTFSRVQKLEVRPVRIGAVLGEMKPLVGNAMGGRFAVTWDVEDEAEMILADTTQLEVALLNLAINARDAMGEQGTLSVTTRRVELSGDAELAAGPFLELAIRDTGSGMAPEVAERVFEPFFTTKEVGKGTGLGLSMVYGMVRQSGGTARIDSAVGEGTTVRLFFRLAQSEVATEQEMTGSKGCAQSVRDRKILVIDDDADVREFIERTLEDLGARVSGAVDGAAGLAAFAVEQPDLVVLDYAMPGLSGAEVAEAILREAPDQPILFVSGYSETAAIQKQAPGAPLLAKPFSAQELEAALCGLLPE